MLKKTELEIILNNIKKKLIFFILLNVIILSSFFYFYESTKNIKNEQVSIKLVTDDFPTVTKMLENFKFYIEFVTDYELIVEDRIISSLGNKTINKNEIIGYLDKYMENYHYSIINLNESIKDNELQAETSNSIDFYFIKVNLFDRVYKLGDVYSMYKYKPINYLTIIFSLFLFLNFFLYVLFLVIEHVKKIK